MSDWSDEQVRVAREAVGDIMDAARFAVTDIGVLRREDLEIALASELLARDAECARLRAEVEALRAERDAWQDAAAQDDGAGLGERGA